MSIYVRSLSYQRLDPKQPTHDCLDGHLNSGHIASLRIPTVYLSPIAQPGLIWFVFSGRMYQKQNQEGGLNWLRHIFPAEENQNMIIVFEKKQGEMEGAKRTGYVRKAEGKPKE